MRVWRCVALRWVVWCTVCSTVRGDVAGNKGTRLTPIPLG